MFLRKKQAPPSLPSTRITWRFLHPFLWVGPDPGPRDVSLFPTSPSPLGPRFPWSPSPHVPRQLHPRHIHMHPLTESTLSCEKKKYLAPLAARGRYYLFPSLTIQTRTNTKRKRKNSKPKRKHPKESTKKKSRQKKSCHYPKSCPNPVQKAMYREVFA